VKCLLPDPVYFKLKALAMFNRKTLSYYLTAGAKYVLAHHSDAKQWPREYWDDFRATMAAHQQGVNRAERRLEAVVSKESAATGGAKEAVLPLARAKRTDKSSPEGG
jgi:hypothetical protein